MMSGMKDLFGDEPFGEAHARNTDPGTSHAAARSVRAEANDLEAIVSRSIARRGDRGMICDEIVDATQLNWNTVSPRLRPLCKKGIITSRPDGNGKPITRPGKSGRRQIVWFVVKVTA
jgi:hypothetical protein